MKRSNSAGTPVVALVLGLVIVAVTPIAAKAESWQRYVNARFGTAVDYPASKFSNQPSTSANGDGATFQSTDGTAEFLVWGANTISDWGFSDFVASFGERTPVSWSENKSGHWIATGISGGQIRYSRCNLRGDILDCFELTYPSAEKAAWDAIVTRMSHSLGGS